MRRPRPLNLSHCDVLYHLTKLLLMAYAMPERPSAGKTLHAASMSVMNASSSCSACGNFAVGTMFLGQHMGGHRRHVDDRGALAGDPIEDLVDVDRADRVRPHDVFGATHAGAHPCGVDDRGDGTEAGCRLEQPGDRLSVGDVAIDGLAGDSEAFQAGDGGVEPVLPDVAEDDRVVSPDDFRRGGTHAACASGDHRYRSHGQ